MKHTYNRYTENLPEEFSIKEKISNTTEKKNFHLHKQLEIVFALSDNLKCRSETSVIDIPRNGMILFNQMDLHYIFSEEGTGQCHRYVLYFSSDYISMFSTPEVNLLECFLLRIGNQPVVLTIPEKQTGIFTSILLNMEHYSDECQKNIPPIYGKGLHLKFLLGEFLILTNQIYREQFGSQVSLSYQAHSQLVYDIYEYINKHYNSDLDLNTISKLFLISKTQLYYIFHEITGITVSDYITEFRITKAKDFLINTDYSIEMIGQAVGYINISSFSRSFKGRVSCSPIQYRKKHVCDTK